MVHFFFLYTKYSILNFNDLKSGEYFHFLAFIVYSILIVTMILWAPGPDLDVPDVILYEFLFFQIFFYCAKSLYYLRRRSHLISACDKRIRVMKVSSLYAINMGSVILFGSSFFGSHLLLFIGRQTLPSGFVSFIQVSITLVILIICFLNTETMTAKILEHDDFE